MIIQYKWKMHSRELQKQIHYEKTVNYISSIYIEGPNKKIF